MLEGDRNNSKTTLQQAGNTRSCAKGFWAPGGHVLARTQCRSMSDIDEPVGKLTMQGLYVGQHLSLAEIRKACGGQPGSERYSGNPTVADRRGAAGNVIRKDARACALSRLGYGQG
jgi:hypothetical protein